MPSISLGGVAALGAVAGGGISALGAQSAAKTQAAASEAGITAQINELQNISGLMGPYINAGSGAAQQLSSLGSSATLGSLTAPFNPTMAQLEATPGYQFTLNQGLQGVANAYSGQGLGNGVVQGATATTPSGPGIKGALNYAEGLASTTYQQQFSNYLAQNSQIYNMMAGQEQLGEAGTSALAGVSQAGISNITGLNSAAGAATAAGIQSGANALGQGISGGASNFALLNALGGGSLFGAGGGTGGLISDASTGDQIAGGSGF
jgi:hypothetical protein